MKREVNIYDIQTVLKNNKAYFKKKEKIGTMYFNYDDIEDRLLSLCNNEIYNKMEIDKIYYLIEEIPSWKIVGVASLHKGYTYIDCAEHDDRVIIKTAFPNQKCGIIGER